MDVTLIILCFILALLLLLYYVTTSTFNYWKKKNVPHEKPIPLFGNYAQYILLRKFTSEVSQELCRKYQSEPYFGTYFGTEPALVIQDPDVIKLVFTKDFYYFNSRELMDYTEREVITQNLFFSHGDRWKVIRQNLTSLFTSAKIKNMFYLIKNCAHMFEDMLDYETSMSSVLEARALMTRYTMDCICNCGFGVETNTMEKNPKNNLFLHMGHLIFDSSVIQGIKYITRTMWPKLFYGLGLKYFPSDIDNFFNQLLTGVFKSRGYQPTKRSDFVDLVLSLKNNNNYIVGDSMNNSQTGDKKKIQIKVDDDLLVAQCVVFFAAGFETSASALSLCLYELAKNQKAQRRAQQEVDEYLRRHNNELNYDCVNEMPFLDACVSETLRLYPVLPIITREVVEDYTFPSGLRLERGTRVHLPVYHLHRHPAHFPEPESYKPERFLPDAEHPIKPFTFFPFGEGPRYCIGMRFSKMQVIPGLMTFLKKYNVELAPGAPETVKFATTTILMQPADGLPVTVTPREGWETRVYTRSLVN